MDRVNTCLFEGSDTHWTNVRPLRINSSKTPQGELLKQYEEHGFHTFIASTIQAGLTLYVGQKLETRHIREKKGRPLLDYALRPWMVSQLELPDLQNLPNPMMVQLLLQRGSDPMQRIQPTGYTGHTVWIFVLVKAVEGWFSHPGGHKVDVHGVQAAD